MYNSYTDGIQCDSVLWMLYHVTGCVVADSNVTVHLLRLESVIISLKTCKCTDMSNYKNLRKFVKIRVRQRGVLSKLHNG